MNHSNNAQDRLTLAAIVQPILEEDRRLDLSSRDIALIAMVRHEVEKSEDGLLAIPYSAIQALSSRLDLLDVKDEQKAERRVSESMTRLIKAGCISKADMARIRLSADAEYQLTSLGEAVADWHVDQSRFTGEPLTTIFRAFISQLSRIADDAENAQSADDWHFDVILQTQHVLRDMLVSIQRHQKELDRQHAAMREFIPTLLTIHSEESIEQCEEQLAQVVPTIEDLQEAILSSSSTAFALIDRIETLAKPYAPKGMATVYDDLFRRLQSINQWTAQRAIDWMEHYNVVQNFLRTVIHVGPQRRLTQSLKRAIAIDPDWTFEVADEPRFVRMRTDISRDGEKKQAPRVPTTSQERERDFEEILPDELPELLIQYLEQSLSIKHEALASNLLVQASKDVHDHLKLIPHFPWLIGVMTQAGIFDPQTRNWVTVSKELEIEELRVIKNDFLR